MEKEEIDLEVLPTPDYKKGSEQFMASLKEEAKKYGFELKFLGDVYPLRQMPNWYSDGAIAEIIYSDKISIMITIDNYDFEVRWVEGNPNDRFSTPDELESIGIFTDIDMQKFLDENIIEIEYYGLFDFYIVDEDTNFTGTYSDVVYGSELGFDQASELGYAFDFKKYKEDVIPEYLKKYGSQSQLNENKKAIDNFIDRFGKELSDRFFKLKPRLKSPENDISYWMKKSSNDLTLKLDEIDSIKTFKQKQDIARQGSKLLYSDGNWDVYEITTLEASIKYGKETKWCISGVDCDSQDMWNFYTGGSLSPRFNKDTSVFIFFIHKSWDKKWAVLFDKSTKNSVIWNELDNITSFIEDSPKIKGLPDFSKIPFKLKQDISKSLKIKVDNIIEIRETESLVYTDDHLEKYWVMYLNSLGETNQANVYRSPDTEQFVKF